MARLELKYCKRQLRERRRKDGTTWRREYWYYRRPGAPDDGSAIPGLPGDPEFHAAVRLFNDRADHRPPEHTPGTFAHLVMAYRASPDFTSLRDKTRQDYSQILARLVAMLGPFPVREIDREAVYAIRDKHSATPSMANAILRVLRLLLSWAQDRGIVKDNAASRPKALRVDPRRQVWDSTAEARFMAVADAPMRLAYLLHAHLAQRQADILALRWDQYVNGAIRLRQGKTDALVEVPAHRDLRAVLDALPRRSAHILCDSKGKRFAGDHFRHEWRKATLAAGLDGLQNRDLRRTAMVRMAEAGATDIEIAAVSGHDIDSTRRILETYLPRNSRMAAEAIRKLEGAKPA